MRGGGYPEQNLIGYHISAKANRALAMSKIAMLTQDELEQILEHAAARGAALALSKKPAEPDAKRKCRESPREAAERWRVHVTKVRKLIKSGELRSYPRPGRGGHLAQWLDPKDVDAVMVRQ